MMMDGASLFNEAYDLVYQQDETKQKVQEQQDQELIRIDLLVQKRSGLSENQKNQVFSYLQNGDKLMKESQGLKSENYIQNAIILIDSIFQYAYFTDNGPKSTQSSSIATSLISGTLGTLKSTTSMFTKLGKSILQSSSSSKDIYTEQFTTTPQPLVNNFHYWDNIRTHFSHHDTVKYINFHYDDAASNKEKGIGWVLLILIEKEFLNIITELFQNATLLNMYNTQHSYFWKNQAQLVKTANIIMQKDLEFRFDLVNKYRAYKQTKQHQQQVFTQNVIEMVSEQNKSNEQSMVVPVDDSPVRETKVITVIEYPRLNLYDENEINDSVLRNSSFITNTNNISIQNTQLQQNQLAKSLGLYLLGQEWEQTELQELEKQAHGVFSEKSDDGQPCLELDFEDQLQLDESQDNEGEDEQREILARLFEQNSDQTDNFKQEIVPYEFRDEFRLVVNRTEGETHRQLRNSDLILLNELYFPFQENIYIPKEKEKFLYGRFIKGLHLAEDQCTSCLTFYPAQKTPERLVRRFLFGKQSIQNPRLHYCFFCRDKITCSDCMSDIKCYIPHEIQVSTDLIQVKKAVCKQAYAYLKNQMLIKIESRNPVLNINSELRKLVVLRRSCQKMFDLLKCPDWKNLLSKNNQQQSLIYTVKDCYLRSDISLIEQKQHLQELYEFLAGHLTSGCKNCKYNGEICKICGSTVDLFFSYQVDKVNTCHGCGVLGHRVCIANHKCQQFS